MSWGSLSSDWGADGDSSSSSASAPAWGAPPPPRGSSPAWGASLWGGGESVSSSSAPPSYGSWGASASLSPAFRPAPSASQSWFPPATSAPSLGGVSSSSSSSAFAPPSQFGPTASDLFGSKDAFATKDPFASKDPFSPFDSKDSFSKDPFGKDPFGKDQGLFGNGPSVAQRAGTRHTRFAPTPSAGVLLQSISAMAAYAHASAEELRHQDYCAAGLSPAPAQYPRATAVAQQNNPFQAASAPSWPAPSWSAPPRPTPPAPSWTAPSSAPSWSAPSSQPTAALPTNGGNNTNGGNRNTAGSNGDRGSVETNSTRERKTATVDSDPFDLAALRTIPSSRLPSAPNAKPVSSSTLAPTTAITPRFVGGLTIRAPPTDHKAASSTVLRRPAVTGLSTGDRRAFIEHAMHPSNEVSVSQASSPGATVLFRTRLYDGRLASVHRRAPRQFNGWTVTTVALPTPAKAADI